MTTPKPQKTPEEIARSIVDEILPDDFEIRRVIASAIRAERERKIEWPSEEEMCAEANKNGGAIFFMDGVEWLRNRIENGK